MKNLIVLTISCATTLAAIWMLIAIPAVHRIG